MRRSPLIGLALSAVFVLAALAPALALDAGSLDPTFGTDGVQVTDLGFYDHIRDIAIQPDGKIVTVGWSSDLFATWAGGMRVARFDPDGSLDTSFASDGMLMLASFWQGEAVAIQPDGKIVIAGIASDQSYGIVRLNADGSLDSSFSGDGIATTPIGEEAWANDLALQTDGKIVVVGRARIDGMEWFGTVRYNANGSLDPTFDGDGIALTAPGEVLTPDHIGWGRAKAVAIQPDGKIVVGGLASMTGSDDDFALVRYLPNGSLDPAFDGGDEATVSFGALDVVNDLVIQPNGRIVAIGDTTNDGNYYSWSVARFLANGTLDTSFNGDGKISIPFSPSGSRAWGVALQSDGAIVVGGESDEPTVLRFTSTGTLDPTFSADGIATVPIAGVWGGAEAVAIDGQDRIVAAGFVAAEYFGPFFGPEDSMIARFLPEEGPACTITGTTGDDTLVGTMGNDVICGLGGNDTLSGLRGDDALYGGSGDDKLHGGLGNDAIDGEAGIHDMVLHAGAPGPITASLAAGTSSGLGSDTLAGVEGLAGSAWPDVLTGSGEDERIQGGAGADSITDTAGGADRLYGQAGADVINGADGISGNDTLYGQADADACTADVGDSKKTCEA